MCFVFPDILKLVTGKRFGTYEATTLTYIWLLRHIVFKGFITVELWTVVFSIICSIIALIIGNRPIRLIKIVLDIIHQLERKELGIAIRLRPYGIISNI